MTLHYTDLVTDGRREPSVSSPDVHMNPKSHATDSLSPRAVGTQTVGKVTTRDSRIIANDGSNNIGLFGFDDSGNMVVKVAQTGYDANSATNDKLVFNSAQDVFKVVSKIKTTIPSFTIGAGNANFTLLTTAHGQTFTPIVDVYVVATLINFPNSTFLASSYIRLPVFFAGSGTSSNVYFFPNAAATAYFPLNIIYGVDSTNVYIQASNSGTTVDTIASIATTIYLLQETAN